MHRPCFHPHTASLTHTSSTIRALLLSPRTSLGHGDGRSGAAHGESDRTGHGDGAARSACLGSRRACTQRGRVQAAVCAQLAARASRGASLLLFAWRGRGCGPLGHGPYRKTVGAIREISAHATPVAKAEGCARSTCWPSRSPLSYRRRRARRRSPPTIRRRASAALCLCARARARATHIGFSPIVSLSRNRVGTTRQKKQARNWACYE